MEKILLDCLLEIYSYDREVELWSEQRFSKFPPRLYRLQMIDSLFKALNINCTYQEFLRGEFIDKDTVGQWVDFKNVIEKKLDLTFIDQSTPKILTEFEQRYVFNFLMEYRLRMQDLLNVGSGVLCSFGVFLIPTYLSKNINRKIIKEFAIIDKILCYLINPQKINHPKEILVEYFDFPDVDLDAIDLEYF